MLAALYRLVTLRLTTRGERLREELDEGLGAWFDVPPFDDGLSRVVECRASRPARPWRPRSTAIHRLAARPWPAPGVRAPPSAPRCR